MNIQSNAENEVEEAYVQDVYVNPNFNEATYIPLNDEPIANEPFVKSDKSATKVITTSITVLFFKYM